jgi:hypothetical protein
MVFLSRTCERLFESKSRSNAPFVSRSTLEPNAMANPKTTPPLNIPPHPPKNNALHPN